MGKEASGLFAALFALVLAMAIGPAAAFAAPGAPAGANALKGGVIAQDGEGGDGEDGDNEGDEYNGSYRFVYEGLECDSCEDYYWTGEPVSVTVLDDNADELDKAALAKHGLELRISKGTRGDFDAEEEEWFWDWDPAETIDGPGRYEVGLYEIGSDDDYIQMEEFVVYDTNSLDNARVNLDGDRIWDNEINDVALSESLDAMVYACTPIYGDDDDDDGVLLAQGTDYEIAIKDATGALVGQDDLKKGVVYFLSVIPAKNSTYTGEFMAPIRFYGNNDLSYASLLLDGDELDSEETDVTFPLSEATGITANMIQVMCGDEAVNSKYYTLKLAVGELATDDESYDEDHYVYDREAAEDFAGFQTMGHYLLFTELTEEGKSAGYEQSGKGASCEIIVLSDNDLSFFEIGFMNEEAEIESYDNVRLIEGMKLPIIALYRYDDSDDDEPIVLGSDFYSTALYYTGEDGEDEWEVASLNDPLKVGEYYIQFSPSVGTIYLEECLHVYSAHDLDGAGEVSPEDETITIGDPLPDFAVKVGKTILTENEDYTVSYEQYVFHEGEEGDEGYGEWVPWEGEGQPSEPGDYRFVANGVHPYYGSCSAAFRILSNKSLELASIEVEVNGNVTKIGEGETVEDDIVKCLYTGQPINPTYTLSIDGDPIPTESLNVDSIFHTREGFYEEEGWTEVDKIQERGWYTVWITADGYADETWVDFYVYSDIPEDAVSIPDGPFAYEGVPVEPTVTVTFDGAALVEGEDYEVEYANNNAIGATGTVHVYGIRGYEFDVTKTFVIGNATVDDDQAVAGAVADLIEPLPETVANDTDKAKVEAAVAAFNALSDAQKALISEALQAKLKAAEKSAQQYAAAQANKDKPQAKANTMTVKAKAVKAKAKKLKKKAMKVAPAKAFAVGSPQGAVTYKLLKVKAKKKLQKQAKKKIKVASDGTIKLGKKLKKGTYSLTVQVSAAGNASYKPATKTVTVKVKVK